MPTTATTSPSATSEDTLVPVSSRFSFAAAYTDLPFSDDPPSGAPTRPYVLRVAARPAPRRTATLPPARYCHVRQIAVSADASARPLWALGRGRTTLGSKDGEHNPMEDWTPDN